MILDDIVAVKQKKLSDLMQKMPLDALQKKIEDRPANPKDFHHALKKPGISVIAEVKKASPSKGVIKSDFDPETIARQYNEYGADAVSVLTEEDFFLGCNEYLKTVKAVTHIPVLRKDFIIDIWQVYESRMIGADAILLIVGILTDKQLRTYRETAQSLGMHALVEVHNEEELARALDSGTEIVGINNRNLKTFDVSLETTEKLASKISPGKTIVSESGIKNAEDIRYLKQLGVDAVLVGETLMRAGSIKDQLDQFKQAGAVR